MTPEKPILNYQNPQPRFWTKPLSRRVTFWFFAGLITFVILLISTIPVAFNASPEMARRVKCASNLRQVGQALQLYVADQKALPDDFQKLVTLRDLSPDVFVCPSTHDSPATQPADLKNTPNHCSYIFLFENLPRSTSGSAIIAFENPTIHNEGMNVLYFDGHVDWFPKDKMSYILSELQAGHNPPRKNENAKPSTMP